MSSAFHERFKDRKSTIGKEGILDIKNSVAVSKPFDSQVFTAPVYKSQDSQESEFFATSPYSQKAFSPDLRLATKNNALDLFSAQIKEAKQEALRKQTLSANPIRNMVPVGRSILKGNDRNMQDFRPYTLRDYQNIKTEKYYELGGLGPTHVGTEDWRTRKGVSDKRNQYAKQVQSSFSVSSSLGKKSEAFQFSNLGEKPGKKKKDPSFVNTLGSIIEELDEKHTKRKPNIQSARPEY